ncbi:exodeoxyribonuclease III [Salmonella enterica subsp. enterica serovar Newport]|nr:exodeoxyribonuclease III [Salmonella enterica subsp. enterica serovar Newport]
MRLATFNINNIRQRLDNLLIWLAATEPDIVCLQELKAAQRDFPAAALRKAGYHAVWRGQPSWNGVAILSRGKAPVVTREALPDDPDSGQSRYIEAAVDGVLVGCLYAPNGNPQPGPKFAYKLAWHDRLNAHAADLLKAGVPAALVGDYNVVPEPRDIYKTTSYDDNALVQPQARARFAALLEQGWTDALRARFPDKTLYTFWDYRRQRWERDAGLRLDHILLSSDLAGRLSGAGIDRVMRGAENPSDHAPVWITLK